MQPWSLAMADALYGEHGFYRQEAPTQHFRTSVSASPLFADVLAKLVLAVDQGLGEPDALQIVDVGAGDGRLLTRLLAVLPADVRSRVRASAIELRDRPDQLDPDIEWVTTIPTDVVGVMMAHEYLDNVPCDVVQMDSGRRRQVLVDPEGRESAGEDLSDADAAWMDRWWPITDDGARADVGVERDSRWAQIVSSLTRGLALAVDYGHTLQERTEGTVPLGTLTGYRNGHQVVPTPDGSCDITAHVAIDACAEAGRLAGADHTALIRQREALLDLGLDRQRLRPPLELASTNPVEYVHQLSDASSAAELLSPASLGSFWWLLQSKGAPPPIGTVTLSG